MASDVRTESIDYRVELLSPRGHSEAAPRLPSWRLTADEFKLPQKSETQDSESGLPQVVKKMSQCSVSMASMIFFFSIFLQKINEYPYVNSTRKTEEDRSILQESREASQGFQ